MARVDHLHVLRGLGVDDPAGRLKQLSFGQRRRALFHLDVAIRVLFLSATLKRPEIKWLARFELHKTLRLLGYDPEKMKGEKAV